MRLAAGSVSLRSFAGEVVGSRLSSMGHCCKLWHLHCLSVLARGIGHADERVGVTKSQLRSQEMCLRLAPVRGVVGPEVVEGALDR
eukprot:2287158-Pleurochrysis_carterae.AAC.1